MARIVRGATTVIPKALFESRAAANRTVAARLEDAAEQAQSILAEAHRDAIQIRENAAADGIAEAAALRVAANEERNQLRLDAQDQALELGCQIAEKMIGGAIKSDPSHLQSLIADILETAAALDAERCVLHVHPLDRPELERMKTTQPGFSIKVDSTIARGGCVVVTERGAIDGRLTTRLKNFVSALKALR